MEIEHNTYDKYNRFGKYFYYHHYSESECHLKYAKIIKDKFQKINDLKIMEIGAGHGHNLIYFKYLGLGWNNIYANDILPERGMALKENLPLATVHTCDALELSYTGYFDIVFQSTVFTSVLNDEKKKLMANKMFEMTKKNGVVLWYDFMFDSPNNKKVKGIKKTEISNLFPHSSRIDYYKTTLAPPIGRVIGKLYPVVNTLFFPLRTHLIAVIHK